MATAISKKYLDTMVVKGLMTAEQLRKVLELHKADGGSITQLLVKQGIVTERALMAFLSSEFGIPSLSLAKYTIDPMVAALVPEKLARQHRLVPLAKHISRLVVAMADPLNIFAIDDLKMLTGYAIDPVLASEEDILRAISRCYASEQRAAAEPEGADSQDAAGGGLAAAEVEELAVEGGDQAPIIKMVDLLVVEALKRRASDIHLEPREKALQVRYRVDGNLQEAFQLPKSNQNAILTRLKIMAGLDITEWRLPQDGRFKVRMAGREVDFRVSVLPITYGGKVVLRALDKRNLSIGLDKLGFHADTLAAFKAAIAKPYGMILVTGPTGSGKSTSLYSVLSQLNTPQRNIVTIEDPVEYQVDGITQVQTHHDIGLTFAAGLRALLRQNPDVVMIGEIRDHETADIAMKASLTGQLVLSTLHTNDASGAVTRLIDMGVEPFLVASSVILIAAQRLCRKLCQSCKQPYEPEPAQLAAVGIRVPTGTPLFTAKGCSHCNGTGYFGRMAVLEALTVDEHLRDMIVSRASAAELKAYAVEHGMTTLRKDAERKFLAGDTSLDEVIRVTVEDEDGQEDI